MLTTSTFLNNKYILQTKLFDSAEERVLSLCTVTKPYKKKKLCYLCLVSTPPLYEKAIIYLIKHTDREDEYRKKKNWGLNELKLIDGKDTDIETHEFELYFDKVYKWFAINLHERQNFLTTLFQQFHKMGLVYPQHKNIPEAWMKVNFPQNSIKSEETEMSNFQENSNYPEELGTLTEKEIFDLNKLLGECDFALKNAELFIEKLDKTLYELDGANVQSVLVSEKQVLNLMNELETAVNKAAGFEKKLDTYDNILSHVRDTMETMGGKNALIETANNNNIKLLNELGKIITQLDLPYEKMLTLSEPDLKTDSGRRAAIQAGKILQNAINISIDPSLLRLSAVQDQKKKLEKYRAKFSQSISRHLNNLFIHLGNDLGENQITSNELCLPTHASIHTELSSFMELMHWIKAMDKNTYEGLTKVYTNSMNKTYDRDLRHFFSTARQILSSSTGRLQEDSDLAQRGSKAAGKPVAIVPYGTLGINKEQWSENTDSIERQKFDDMLEKVLNVLEPIVLEEQLFCISFFNIDTMNLMVKSVQASTDSFEKTETDSQENLEFSQKKVRCLNEEVRKIMVAIFGNLEQDLVNFIHNFEKIDSFYTMYVLVRLSQHVLSVQDTHSFLSMAFASALVQMKRNLDSFMRSQLQSIKESKIPKRTKCGILPYVENFEYFAKTTEEIFKKSERRTDIDKWYVQLVDTIFEYITIHAEEHSKTPSQVIRMENFHHMYSVLAQMKINALDLQKKEAKIRYTDALKAYVTKYFGRPLEKLNQFFEGVQQKVSQGVKENEISYQMAFSKQELRKVINQYPAKEVKKGLENLYKKVEKHLCEEENLLQVVWYAMQEEFIAQYNFLEERIQKCYAGAMIMLEFNIHDILEFFSDIARSH